MMDKSRNDNAQKHQQETKDEDWNTSSSHVEAGPSKAKIKVEMLGKDEKAFRQRGSHESVAISDDYKSVKSHDLKIILENTEEENAQFKSNDPYQVR